MLHRASTNALPPMDRHGYLSDLIRSSQTPLTASEVKKLCSTTPELSKLPLAKLRTALEELASWGQLHSFNGAAKAVYYSSQHPQELSVVAMEKLVLASPPLPVAKLATLLPKPLRPWVTEATQKLIVTGKAYYTKSASGQTQLQASPPQPADGLSKAQRQQLEKILAEINLRRQNPRSLEDLLSWLNCPEAPARPVIAQPTADLLRQWYAADTKRSSSSVMVPVLKTWDRYCSWAKERGLEPSTNELRQAIADLYEAGEAILEPADRPGSLSELEKQLLVPLSMGPPGCAWGIL